MPKLTIDNDLLAEEFFEDAFIMGIMAPIPDYHFCNLLRMQLGFDFRHDTTSEIQLRRKKRNYFFSVFRYQEKHSPMDHILYNNRNDGRYLLPECRHIDYVWMIQGHGMANNMIRDLMGLLRNMREVLLLAELSTSTVKHKKNLVL